VPIPNGHFSTAAAGVSPTGNFLLYTYLKIIFI
jgi:hypothetical protein